MKPKIETSKYSEDWLPVKQILNGMIQLDDGNYVTGVKVSPKNIFIMEEQYQDNVIFSLRNLYNTIDFEFWMVISDRPVDISVYLSSLQILYSRSNDAVQRKLIQQDINKANMFRSQEYNVVDTEYYILFKDKKMEVIQKKLHNILSGLVNCGLNSQQVSNNDLRMLLDNLFNAGKPTTFVTVSA